MSKKALVFDAELLEDLLYISIHQSMVLKYRCPKVTVYHNEEDNSFDCHIVFPLMESGVIVDKSLDIDEINGKTLSEAGETLRDFVGQIRDEAERIAEYERDE